METLACEALRLIDLGYRVFPISAGRKFPPLIESWPDMASSDSRQIESWWARWPNANIGLCTTDLLVVDIDGEDNPWPGLDRAKDFLSTSFSVTPRGGRHFVFIGPGRNTQGTLADKVDTRGDAGYIVVAPSLVDGKPYRWINPLVRKTQLDRPPAWLTDALEHERKLPTPVISGAPISEGTRDASLTRLAGAVRRHGATAKEITALLLAVNGRCVPPLLASQVEKIAHSVARYEPDQVSQILLESNWETPAVPQDPDPGPIPPDPPEGFIAQVVKYNLETAFKPQPLLALAGALTLQATLAARKVCDELGNRTNIYCLGVSPSGYGKDHARKVNREILFHAGVDLEGNEDFASDAGLLKAVEKRPAVLFQVDEIGRLFQTLNGADKPHLFHISTILLKLYSSADTIFRGKAYADDKRNSEIDQPCVVLHGLTVPEQFYQGLSSSALIDGFLARMLIFDAMVPTNRQYRNRVPPPVELIECAKNWNALKTSGNLESEHPVPRKAPHSDDARTKFRAFAEIVEAESKSGDPASKALWARAEEKACRLALVAACSRVGSGVSEISEPDMIWAIHLAETSTRRTLWMARQWIAQTPYDKEQKSVLRILRTAGGSLTRSELTRKTQHLKQKERKEVIEGLILTGRISESQDAKQGRAKIIYTAL